MNYLGANMKLIVECSQKLVRLGENLWGKEQELDKEMQEHQKLCDEIMAIQGIEPIEAEMEEVIHCPEGYQFVDENGNVVNATKIVLEKKKNNISLTQEQINIMVHESCVLFCKHCGCGIPRDTCTSLGTCDEHDEYKKHIRLYLMEKECKPAKSLAERVIDYKEFVSLVKKMREAQKRMDMLTGEEDIDFIDMTHIEAREAETEVDQYLIKYFKK